MYSVRVDPGMELIQVPNGIVPTYLCAKQNKRLRVVPGYVFTRTKKDGVERVSEDEWKAIEAIGSAFPSTLNTVTCCITDGPLQALPIHQIDPTIKAVLIRARLLGETRDYWLPVEFSDGTEKKPAEKTKIIYTDEKRAEMLAKAEEIGVVAAARAYGVPWQTFAQLKRWAVKSGGEKQPSRAKKPPISLFVENAILRDKVSSLEDTVARLKRVLADLQT